MKSYKKFVKHNLDAGELDHGLSRRRQILMVDGEPSVVLQPGEGSFDYPSFGKDLELGRALIRTKDNFYNPSEFVRYPVAKRALVSAVSKYLFQTRELVLQLLNDLRSALAVMQVGLMNGNGHREPKCINHNMFLAPFDLFVAVNPSI